MENAILALDEQIAPLEDKLIALKRSRNELLPIHRLPTEILASIFRIASWGYWDGHFIPDSGPRKQFRRGPILLSQVSWLWRRIAFDAREIWEWIYVFETTSSRLVRHFIKRSDPRPIYLIVRHHPSAQVQPGMATVRPRALKVLTHVLNNGVPRLRHLVIMLENPSHLLHSVGNTLPCVSSLETLEITSTHHVSSPAELRLDYTDTPNLRGLALKGCYLPWTSPILLNNPRLHTIQLLTFPQASISQLHAILSGVPELVDLTLDVIPHAAVQGSGNDTRLLSRVLLPKLTTLTLSGAQDAVVGVLQLLRIPSSAQRFTITTTARAPPNTIPPAGIPETSAIQELVAALNEAHVAGVDAVEAPPGPGSRRDGLIAPSCLRFEDPGPYVEHPIYAITANEGLVPGRVGKTDIMLKVADAISSNPNDPGLEDHFPFTFTRGDKGWSSNGWELWRLKVLVTHLGLPRGFWEVLAVLPTLEFVSVKAIHAEEFIRLLTGTNTSGATPGQKVVNFPRLESLDLTNLHIGPGNRPYPRGDAVGIQRGYKLAEDLSLALAMRQRHLDEGATGEGVDDAVHAAARRSAACKVPACEVTFTDCLGPSKPSIRKMFSQAGASIDWFLLATAPPIPPVGHGIGSVIDAEEDSEEERDDTTP